MLEVTPRAMLLIRDFFKDKKKITPIRIFVKLGGCGIRSFGVAIERANKNDEVFYINGFTFIIEKKLWDRVNPVKIDADSISFRISGNGIEPNTGCGTCGFMCGLSGGTRCSGDCINCNSPCAHGQKIREALKKKRYLVQNPTSNFS